MIPTVPKCFWHNSYTYCLLSVQVLAMADHKDCLENGPRIEFEHGEDDQNDGNQGQVDVVFDEETKKFIDMVVEHAPKHIDMIIVIKPPEGQPAIYSQGHPYDICAMTSEYVRQLKAGLMSALE